MSTDDHMARPMLSAEAQANLSTLVPLEEVDNPVLLQGLQYWRQLAGDRKIPSRSDVTPRGLGTLLRNTTLLRVIDNGADYEYRIVGDAYVMAHGISFQGRRWSETSKLSPGYSAMIKSTYDRVVREAAALATKGWIERGGGRLEYIYSEYVFLPLGGEAGGVDHILVFAVYHPREKTGWTEPSGHHEA
ncbi:MAG: PAS domain-containing protein [Alphaproteobacteria bacterium]|nr:PAS domain-containing protein [Alphaproteobacteria bacterium]